jgi:hypothetical protein
LFLKVIEELQNIQDTQGILKQNVKLKCQIKWEEQYGGNIDWTQNLDKIKENQSY